MSLRERIIQYMSGVPGARGWFCTWWYSFHVEPFTTKQIRRELESMKRDGLVESDHSQRNNTKWRLISNSAEVSGCAYEIGDWQCREGGYLWYAGDGEGWDPEDCTHICPHCRTKDYLEAAKEDAESCSSYSNNGDSGTGLDIWTAAEKTALTANHPAACKALSEIGAVSALDGDDSAAGYSVVLCNTQRATP